jgi:phosphoglycerate dehydrogenase-like enzyme
MPKLVIDMAGAPPVWAIPPWAEEEIRRALPAGWDVTVVPAAPDAPDDRPSAAALEAVRGAEIYLGMGVPRELFRAATAEPDRLRWVHTGAAGVGSALFPEMLASPVVLTNSAGVMGHPMAETIMAMVLYFARGLDRAVASMRTRTWSKDAIYDPAAGVREVSDATIGVIGLGGIGRQVAARAHALGMRVLATRRSPGGSEDGVELLHGRAGLLTLLAESDYVVLTLPATPASRGLIGPAELARMKPGAVLVNVARGSTVDEEALVEGLRAGRLRGAGLDVFAQEPLPPESPLWDLTNVLILPHVSAVTPRYWRRETDLILDNLRRYLAGKPLRNVVDKAQGY